jgi:hypothetical protein
LEFRGDHPDQTGWGRKSASWRFGLIMRLMAPLLAAAAMAVWAPPAGAQG